jgi:hypothetical protein
LSDDDIVPELEKYLNQDFTNLIEKKKIPMRVIVSNKENNKNYLEKAKKNKLTKIKLAT